MNNQVAVNEQSSAIEKVVIQQLIAAQEKRIAELEADKAELISSLAAVYMWLEDHSTSGTGDQYDCAIVWKSDWGLAWKNVEEILVKHDPGDVVVAADWTGENA